MKYKTRDKLRRATPEELAVTAGVSLETGAQLWEVIQHM